MSKQIKTGRELQAALVAAGTNALWIAGRGLIVMSSYYGTDCAVQGTYPVYTFAQGLERLAEDLGPDNGSDILGYYANAGKNRGTYQVQ
jgi:hypothetical protein